MRIVADFYYPRPRRDTVPIPVFPELSEASMSYDAEKILSFIVALCP